MQSAEFKRPDGALIVGMGALIILAALAGVLFIAFAGRGIDLKTVALIILGFAGACALGAGFINAGRTPMLTIRPDAFTIPTFFGQRDIPIRPGQPLGEYLASSVKRTSRAGTIEGNKFVHFCTLDETGVLTELRSMHRDAPEIPEIRRAFQNVAGLTVETLSLDPKSRRSRPDVAHWANR